MKIKPIMASLLLAGILIGCGGSGSGGRIPIADGPLKELEQSGELPPLDRSSDIRGPDANNNGIRDDIDAYIASLQVTDGQRKAIEQKARASQSMLLVDVNDPVALRAVSDKGSRAIVCLGAHFPDGKERSAIVTKIESITANTRERAEQYLKYNQALSGGVYRLPSGDTCDA